MTPKPTEDLILTWLENHLPEGWKTQYDENCSKSFKQAALEIGHIGRRCGLVVPLMIPALNPIFAPSFSPSTYWELKKDNDKENK